MTKPMTDERLAEIRKFLTHGGVSILEVDDIYTLLARLDAAEELIREVANSGVSFDDERLKCVELQVGRDTLAQCRSYLP